MIYFLSSAYNPASELGMVMMPIARISMAGMKTRAIFLLLRGVRRSCWEVALIL